VTVHGKRLTCEVDTAELGDLISRLSALGIQTLTSAPPTLEELFLRHYGHDLDSGGAA